MSKSTCFATLFPIFLIPAIYIFSIPSSSNSGKKFSEKNSHFKYEINEDTLHKTIKQKFQMLKHIITYGNEMSSSIEPFNLDSLLILLDDDQTNLNASLTSLNFHGMSNLKVKDIASNIKTSKVGVLMTFPDIKITGSYKIHGIWKNENKEYEINDKGKLQINVDEWRTSWSGKVHEIINTTVKVSQMAVRSHYNDFNDSYDSFKNKEHEMKKFSHLADTISKLLMDKIVNIVDEKLEDIMSDIISEVSTIEMDFDLNKHLKNLQSRQKRQVPCEVGEELDEYVDSLFRFGKRIIRVMEPFQLPNATIDLEEYNLQLFLHSGGATRAYTFERKKPAWVLCTNETISLGLTIQLEEVRVMYKYRVIQDWKLLFDGDLEAQIKRPKFQVQFTQSVQKENEEEDEDFEEEPVMQRIDRLKVWRPGSIRVIVRGLGNLTQTLSMIINNMLKNRENLDPIINMLETDGVDAANTLLKNVTIPILSII